MNDEPDIIKDMTGGRYFFIVSFLLFALTPVFSASAQTQKITEQQLNTWIKTAETNSKPSDVNGANSTVLSAEASGKFKFPIPNAQQIGAVCEQVSKVETTGGLVSDGVAKNACDAWQSNAFITERMVIKLYTVSAINRNAPSCQSEDQARMLGANDCIPTEQQINASQSKTNTSRQALYTRANQSNAQAAAATASDELAESGCPRTSEAAAIGGDTPSTEYLRTHPGATCSALRASAAAASQQESNTTPPAENKSFARSLLDPVANALISTVGGIILSFSTLLLGMAGVLLNVVIAKAVFGFSTVIGNSPGLLIAWGVLRDLGNMILLFGFIFIGIATILDLGTYNAKKALPNLIIFAILLNFSLFVSEAIIDVSNGLASTIYDQSSVACDTTPLSGDVSSTASQSTLNNGSFTGGNCSLNYGIAGDVMKISGLSTLFSAFTLGDSSELTKSIVVYLGLSLFALVGAMVLFAAAIMLVARTVILTFLMIVSPVGFAGMAIPPLQKYAQQWWGALISQSLFAPVLLLFVLISLKVASSFAENGENKSLAAALISPSSDVMGVIFVFLLVIGLLIGSLIMSKKIGAIGGSTGTSLGAKFAFGGAARGSNIAFNSTGKFLNNRTAGGVARLQNSAFAQRNRFTRGVTAGVTGAAGALSAGVFKPAATGNFDFRRVGPVSAALKQAGAGDGAKASGKATLADMQKQFKDSKKKLGSSAFTNQVDRIRIEQEFNNAGGGAPGAAAVMAMFGGKGLGQISAADTAQLPSALLVEPTIVRQFNQKILEEMQNAGKLKPAEMTAIGNNIRNPQNGAAPRLVNYVTRGPGATIW